MFAAAASLANNAVMAVYGQTVTVTVGATATDLTGVYLAPNDSAQNPTGSPFSRPDPRVLIRTSDLDGLGAAEGDTITIDATVYRIVNLEGDDGGVTTATVRLT